MVKKNPYISDNPKRRKDKIDVAYFVDKLRHVVNIDIEILNYDQEPTDILKKKWITDVNLHRPGLALTGYTDLFTFHRIQIMGNTECHYLKSLSEEKQKQAFHNLTEYAIPIIFTTNKNTLDKPLLDMAAEAHIPIYTTSYETTHFMYVLREFLDDQFAISSVVHGTMVDVYGVGILVVGKSGIGKSEVGLDLVERGHRLVADDVVVLSKKGDVLITTPTNINKHYMEIRGLGILDVMRMFGIRAIRYQKRLEVIMELILWDETTKIERLGLEREKTNIYGIEIPFIQLPISLGKNLTVITEVIALNYLLEHYGFNAAQSLKENMEKAIKIKQNPLESSISYFEGDKE